MATEAVKPSVDIIGDMAAWGGHFCLFYETKEDLRDALTSYCKSGLENDEFCIWVVAEPLTIEEATAALKEATRPRSLRGGFPYRDCVGRGFFPAGWHV